MICYVTTCFLVSSDGWSEGTKEICFIPFSREKEWTVSGAQQKKRSRSQQNRQAETKAVGIPKKGKQRKHHGTILSQSHHIVRANMPVSKYYIIFSDCCCISKVRAY